MQKTALVIGATGLTGTYLVDELVASNAYSHITLLVRGKYKHPSPKVETLQVDFADLPPHAAAMAVNHVYCTIGTTIAVAKTRENFTFVDYTIPFEIAQLAKQQGAEKFILMSSVGADADSGNFYLRTKGQLEQAIINLHFEYTHIVRPSLLMGPRREMRVGEIISKGFMQFFGFAFVGGLKKYKAIPAHTVAVAMLNAAFKADAQSLNIYEGHNLFALAEAL